MSACVRAVHACVRACIHACMRMHVCVYTRAYVYTQVQVHTLGYLCMLEHTLTNQLQPVKTGYLITCTHGSSSTCVPVHVYQCSCMALHVTA